MSVKASEAFLQKPVLWNVSKITAGLTIVASQPQTTGY